MVVGPVMSRVQISTVLAIDTATPAVTAGIVRRHDLVVLGERVTVDARAHAERLTPNVLAALADAALTMADLDAVVVGCGPGPFTGLRAGMASAAAYGHALGIPVYGVCSLDAIGGQTIGDTLVVTDARRREVYWARYCDGIRTVGPAVNAAADVDPGPALAVAGAPEHAALFALPCVEPSRPSPAGLVAAVNWADKPAPLVPLYLRRPQTAPGDQPATAPGGPVGLATDLELPEPDPQPADAPPPGDVTEAPAETPQVSNIAYTKKLWQAIRAQDVCGNDALDSLAQPYVIG